MSYVIQNMSGGLLVCSLKDVKKTLRLNNKEKTTISKGDMTPHLENLAKRGYIKLSQDTVVEKKVKEKEG